MSMRRWTLGFGLGLALAACGGGDDEKAAGANAAASAANASVQANAAEAQMPACPFRQTHRWAGSVEGGRVLVTGNVDLMMAGFRPALTPRADASPGTLALDLALAPEANAPVEDLARYEGSGGGYRRGEIWCGGERIASFDMVSVN